MPCRPAAKNVDFHYERRYNRGMANFDELFKEITSKYPYALAALALKTSDVEVGDRLNTEHITVRVHHSDMTFHIELPDEDAILHIEAQTDDSRHRPMPLRMLAYSSVLSLEHKKNVYSTVLYFRPPAGRRDTGIYEYGHPERGGGWFKYNVIRMYELEGEAFLDPEALGLLPFTALMKPPADLTAEAWIERCAQTTQQASVDKETRGTLLFALSLFGSLVHPLELFQNPITEALMQESPFYEHVLQQGARQTSIKSILLILTERFPDAEVPAVQPRLEAIADLNRLQQLTLNASIASSFHDFREELEA